MNLLSTFFNIDNYYCVESSITKNGETQTSVHIPDTKANLLFLQNFGYKGFNSFDFDHDNDVDTADFMLALSGFGTKPEVEVDIDFTNSVEVVTVFGEGNLQLSPDPLTGTFINGESFLFGFYKTTPGDEKDPTEYVNPRSFRLELITTGGTYRYSFVSKGYVVG